MSGLLEILARYQDDAGAIIAAGFLVFLRIGAAMATLPALGEQSIPVRVRLVLTLVLTAAIAPSVPQSPVPIASAFFPEVVIGLFLGITLRFFIFALMTAGTIAANATSLSQLFAPGAEPQTAVSQLLVMGGLAVALQLDLHLKLVSFLLVSYTVFPIGEWPNSEEIANWGVEHTARMFSLALKLSMPFVIVSLLYNLALGVINRAMPQLMVMFVGAPALSLVGLILIALVVPAAIGVWLMVFGDFLAVPIGSAW